MELKRVVVTGMGVISPIGNSVDTFWDSVKQQKVGIKPIDRFDTTDYKVKVAGQVDDFVAKDYMDPKTARRMERFCQFAIAASKQAIEQSGL
ncbi:MAG: beta-ketoacyl synthase N-terminal-like domain-containing protein, partial [Prevotellamassilia sp.]|nr:beta-ketoacyl synthase N-terminal-like domain-containing protein [Prevotellamassilia sp.]